MSKYISGILLTVIPALFLLAGFSFGGQDDNFGQALRLEGEHFTIYYPPQLKAEELDRKLGIRPFDTIISRKTYSSGLSGSIDTLFTQVCDILDMQLYSFHGTIKICRDFEQASAIYDSLFGKELTAKSHSFFVNDLNTIYVSADHFKRGILAHEIGHAIISAYFAVPPPVKIQEVLAAFVEYQLRKESQ